MVRLGDACLDLFVRLAVSFADLSHKLRCVLAQRPVVVRWVVAELLAQHAGQNGRQQLMQLQNEHVMS